MRYLLGCVLLMGTAYGQVDLTGVIDIHVHSAPDVGPRSIDALDLARLAKKRGMRALVLKNHSLPTAELAYIIQKEVPGIQIFGGIALNRSVGGINPEAVERMSQMAGGLGRVVWMPTEDSEQMVRYWKENRPFVPVSEDGQLLPEVKQVIGVAAKYHLTLETGHLSPEEGLMVVREAHREGVQHIVVTHAFSPPVNMTIQEMMEAAHEGAYIEFVSFDIVVSPKREVKRTMIGIENYVKAIRAVGPASCILASDLGQVNNPSHPDGLANFFEVLLENGFTQQEIDMMSKTNPAAVLGLP